MAYGVYNACFAQLSRNMQYLVWLKLVIDKIYFALSAWINTDYSSLFQSMAIFIMLCVLSCLMHFLLDN